MSPLHIAPQDEQPLVSVIVSAVSSTPTLLEAIAAYEAQSPNGHLEVIVVERCGTATQKSIRAQFPRVQVIDVPPGTPIPVMRATGFAASRGRLVGFAEDHTVPKAGWLDGVETAYREGHTAIGGPVENACTSRVVDRAVFYCEYIQFCPPMSRGNVPSLPGNNSVYQRALVEALAQEHCLELWEWFWQPVFRERKVAYFCNPAIRMLHKKSFGFWNFLGQRFHYARSFAATRMARSNWLTRVVCGAAALALPGILLPRIVCCAVRKGCGWEFWSALPLLVPYSLAWAIGESAGSLLGPGHSMELVE